jgi:hypothetical protein
MTLAWIAEGYVRLGSHLVKNSFPADSSPEKRIQVKGVQMSQSQARLGNSLLGPYHWKIIWELLTGDVPHFWLAVFATVQKPRDHEYRNLKQILEQKWIKGHSRQKKFWTSSFQIFYHHWLCKAQSLSVIHSTNTYWALSVCQRLWWCWRHKKDKFYSYPHGVFTCGESPCPHPTDPLHFLRISCPRHFTRHCKVNKLGTVSGHMWFIL